MQKHPDITIKKILFLAANPTTETWLALDEECRAIEAKIRAADYRDSLELVTKWAVRPNDLLQYFHEHKPQVVHFSGHGTKSGEIMLVGKNRTSKTVAGPALKNLFAALKGNIHVVVLNACYSASQAKAITSVVDCCIGMNDAVLDDAAIAFAAAFYQAIGFGESVKAAFDCGIAAISIEGISETRTPKLLCRRGVNPDKVFVLKSHSAQRTVGLSTPPRANRLLPCLVAKFQEIDGDLCRVTGGRCPEYGLDLWIEGAPPETKTAAFEILDKGFREPKWSVPRMSASESVSVREFLTDDMSSYGDVEIWIRGVGQGRGSWASQSTLYEALSRYYHGHQKSKGIRRALKQIQTK